MIEAADCLAGEREKYDTIWGFDQYREYSPGLVNVERFLKLLEPEAGESIIDFGCGDGRAGLEFKQRGLQAYWLDLSEVGLVPEVDRKRFYCQPVWQRVRPPMTGLRFDYGFCCDVMEHLPPEYTVHALANMLECCRTVYLQIALRPDVFGALVGQPLHLTVQPFAWWRDRIASIGKLLDARDLCGDGLYIASRP